jgi:hypothetical protein
LVGNGRAGDRIVPTFCFGFNGCNNLVPQFGIINQEKSYRTTNNIFAVDGFLHVAQETQKQSFLRIA